MLKVIKDPSPLRRAKRQNLRTLRLLAAERRSYSLTKEQEAAKRLRPRIQVRRDQQMFARAISRMVDLLLNHGGDIKSADYWQNWLITRTRKLHARLMRRDSLRAPKQKPKQPKE
jgi:hypothetical protein